MSKNTFELCDVQSNGAKALRVTMLNGKRIRPLFLYREQAEAILSEEFQLELGKFIDENTAVLTHAMTDEERKVAKEKAKALKEVAELEAKLAALKAKVVAPKAA